MIVSAKIFNFFNIIKFDDAWIYTRLIYEIFKFFILKLEIMSIRWISNSLPQLSYLSAGNKLHI